MFAAELIAEEVIEGRHRLPLHRTRYVRAEVQRDADLAVPEHLVDHLGVDAQLQQQRLGTVAQVEEDLAA